jgi:hypothetical protein
MSSDLLQYLAKKVNDEITVLSDDLARGTAKDHGEYKYVCGIIRGLMMANSVFEETSRKMAEEYDD